MKQRYKLLCIGILSGFIGGCSTSGYFVVPEGSKLYLHDRPQPERIQKDGLVNTRPFFWTASDGVQYKLEKDGKVTKEGKLRANFRVVSIFWPPLALIYWPIGLNRNITYDLVKDKQE
jgi:hypothetical protein